MVKKLNEKQKRFISTKYAEEEDTTDILRAFGDAFGFLPTSKTIEKYSNYNQENPEEEEEEEEGEEGKIGAIERDTRLEKELIDIESIDTDDEIFSRLSRNINKSKHDTFNLLQEALRRGYKKVDIATGDIEK